MSLRHTSVRRTTAPDKLEVHLTDVETRICDLLHDCSKFLHIEKGIETSCRIAGGWVRDKVNIPPSYLSYDSTFSLETAAWFPKQ
jgi:tRNA nucleotidyltransferase (CCA-adding enzyme)